MAIAEDRKVEDVVRQSEAARILEVTRPTVIAMHSRGEIDGEWIGEVLFLSRSSVEAAAERRAAERSAAA